VQDETGELHGIAFAAVRETQKKAQPHTLEIYAAVAPELRRQGLGRALLEPMLALPEVRLRARVRDTHQPGRAFLSALGFVEISSQLLDQDIDV
jgi:GNAT superfamily N-acetyltransferase